MTPASLLSRLTASVLLACLGLPAAAQDLSISGFGTLGYARSNRAYAYQRSIDEHGTADRDSVLGAQADWRINPAWSATLQLKAAPSLNHDGRWDLTPAWAFVAWRPSDDWLLRAGRLRVPLYLHSEALDVGVTHDMARLPAEMYSITPTSDFNGAYATKTWAQGEGELSLDVYAGRIGTTARFWHRDGLPPVVAAGAQFLDIDVRASGAVLTQRQPDTTWRVGLHRTVTRQRNSDAVPTSFPFVPIGPGLGYYKVSSAQPGPDIPTVDSVSNIVFTLGVEQQFGPLWRVTAEFARNLQRDTEVGSDSRGGYVAVFRSVGRATPYVSLGALRSTAGVLDWYKRLTETQLPGVMPGAAQANAAQRVAAESFYALDQRSLALGSAYRIDARQKLKLEWMRTHIGQVSLLVDALPGSPTPHDTHVDVWSVNYSFTF